MSRRADIVTVAVAVAVHAVGALAIARQDRRPTPVRRPIEVEFRPPAPPPPVPTVVAPPVVARPAPRPIGRKLAISTPPTRPTPPTHAPASPDPPTPRAAPPVYGIAMESPIDASSAIAAARGGSGLGVAGGSRRGTVGGAGTGPAGRAAELDVRKMPEIDTEACGRSIHYPQEAEHAGVEGRVRLRVALDARGQVTSAHVVRGLGHGLDQAAVEALTHRCRFTPAIGSDGRPVPFVIESYTFTFELPR